MRVCSRFTVFLLDSLIFCLFSVETKAASVEELSSSFLQNKPEIEGVKGKILFQAFTDNHWNLFVLDIESWKVKRLTSTKANDEHPDWSEDGKLIVFESDRDGKRAIYIMNENGSGLRRISNPAYESHDPAWSPDGKKIAYGMKKDGHEEIFIADLNKGKESQMTSTIHRSILPAWRPDGKMMAFARNVLGWDIYTMNADGSDVRKITGIGGNCRPDWSPDGKRIAYVSDRADGKGDVWVMDHEGENKTILTISPETHDYDPSWSPDGKWIAYQSAKNKKDGPWAILIIPSSGGNPVRLTKGLGGERFPDWK